MVLPASVVATPNLNCLGALLSHSIATVAKLLERVAAPETIAFYFYNMNNEET